MLTITGYEWTSGQFKQVAYITPDNHIWELFFGMGAQEWSSIDLTAKLKLAAVSDSTKISSFDWVAGKSKHLVYNGDDGHIHELSCVKGWSAADLFDGKHITNSAAAAKSIVGAPLAGYQYSALGTKQIAYFGVDLRLHELFASPGNIWTHADLSTYTNTFQSWKLYNINAYEWPDVGGKQVVLASLANPAGRLEEFHLQIGFKWTATDLMKSASVPNTTWADDPVTSCGLARFKGGGNHVIYKDAARRLHLLHASQLGAGGSFFWTHIDLMQFLPGNLGNIVTIPTGCDWLTGGAKNGSRQIHFATQDGHIHELFQLYSDTSAWHHVDLSNKSPNAPHFATGQNTLTSFEWTAGSSKQVIYPSADGNLHEFFFTAAQGWAHRQITGLTGGAPAARL